MKQQLKKKVIGFLALSRFVWLMVTWQLWDWDGDMPFIQRLAKRWLKNENP